MAVAESLASISYPPIPLVDLGPITVSMHGVAIGLGLSVGAWLIMRDVDRRGLDGDAAVKVLAVGLLSALVFARLFSVPLALLRGDSLSAAFESQSSFAGIAGGIGVAWLMTRRLGLPFIDLLDMTPLALAVGVVLARLGDLAIVEHLGSRTDFVLGYLLRPGDSVAPQHSSLETSCATLGDCGPYHHTALYDLVGAAVLVIVVVAARRFWSTRSQGQLFAVWAIWYGLQRFLVDFGRVGAAREGLIADRLIGPFTASQWGALALACVGLMIWALSRRWSTDTEGAEAQLRTSPSEPDG